MLEHAYNSSTSELREGCDKFGVILDYKLCVTCLKKTNEQSTISQMKATARINNEASLQHPQVYL